MTTRLRQDQWTKLLNFLQHHPQVYVGEEAQCRRFIEGVDWISRTGAQWRELPDKYGNWNSVYKRFSRWCAQGIWEEMLAYFAQDPDYEWLVVDSSIVRAHPCAAGAAQKKGGKQPKHLVVVAAVSVPKSM